MKTLMTTMSTGLLAAFLFVSCTSQRIDRKIDHSEWDSLADESYLRWGENRLKKDSQGAPEVVKCYQGKSKETLDLYRKEYLTRKDGPYYWIHVGNCYFVDEKWTKAEFFYRQALDEAKTANIKSIALNNLGLIHFKHEQWERGRERLKEAIALAPKFKVPRYNLSQLYLQFGLYEKAIETLNHASFKAKKDIDVHFSLANAYLYKGDLKEAGRYFSLIPKGFFSREDIAATYALYLIKMGNIQEASRIMKERDRSGVVELTVISQKIEKILSQRMKEE
jgi:tetratricopeptide (TPR) repeat protein